MTPLIPWIAPGLALAGMLIVWALNRRSTVLDRVADDSAELKLGYIEAERAFLDRLEKRIASLEEQLDEALRAIAEERRSCQIEQDRLRIEMNAMREYMQRRGWDFPAEGRKVNGETA